MSHGTFTIQTRIYLDDAQRSKLDALLREQARDLDELLSDLLVAYLAEQATPPSPAPDDPTPALRDELRRRRAELRRLRPALTDRVNPPPPWLAHMAAELEREIAQLEEALSG
jgi:hypothetical protein